MENFSETDVFLARRRVGVRDEQPPPPELVTVQSTEEMIETELGLRPKSEWEITLRARRAHLAVKELARTDYVVTKSMETGRKLLSAWTSWRQHLRDVVNGNGEDVRPEPDRWAVAELEQPEAPLLPAPDALMSDYGPVGAGYDDVTGDMLLDAFEQDEAEAVAVIQVLSATRQRHISEQLNVDKARYRREHMLTDQANPREASIDRLLGLLTRRGD